MKLFYDFPSYSGIKIGITYILFSGVLLGSLSAQTKKSIPLNELRLNDFEIGVVASKANISYGGTPMKIAGQSFEKGVGVRAAVSSLFIDLQGKATHFSAFIGHDDAGIKDIGLSFYVLGDEKVLFESKPMKVGDKAVKVDVDLANIQKLGLLVINPIATVSNRTFGDWAEANVITLSDRLLPVTYQGDPYILTPKTPAKPIITGPKIFGARPGNPFLFTVSATGTRPMIFSSTNLPYGLTLNKQTGIITGSVKQPGLYQVMLSAQNKKGTNTRLFRIKIGDTICLTPPIGWNGWNSWGSDFSQEKVYASAKAMVAKGLNNHGWSYINIDDTWEGKRGGKYNAIQPNEKFPDFKKMIDDLHAMGFKTGLYSTPWVATYAGYIGESSDFEDGRLSDTVRKMSNKRPVHYYGKYHFAKNDAAQWAEWGIDFLKYDWPVKDLPPTEEMGEALKKSGRDIVFSLSNNAAFEKATDWARLANSWRTGGDIRDTWQSIYYWGFMSDRWAPFAGPGHWNDPDMLVLGNVTMSSPLHYTRLTPDEQYTHVSLWSLMAAPMLIGCPVEQMDDFTLSLLSNDEVLEINQDALGKQGRLISNENGNQIWAKPMEDGSLAVGLFNTGNFGNTPPSFFNWGTNAATKISIDFEKLGLKGKYTIRDVWRQKNVGVFEKKFTTEVPYHGVVMLRINK